MFWELSELEVVSDKKLALSGEDRLLADLWLPPMRLVLAWCWLLENNEFIWLYGW